MSGDVEILLAAINAETARAAGRATTPMSVSFDFLPHRAEGALTAKVAIERVTRTLVFSTADLLDSAGVRTLTATAVHKINS